ncbi:hypothetical protein ACLOJK_027427 [Asimina triloba]
MVDVIRAAVLATLMMQRSQVAFWDGARSVIWKNRDLVGNVVSWFCCPVLAYIDLPWIEQIVLPIGSKDECLDRSVRMDAARRKQLLTVDWGGRGGHRTPGDADLKALLDGMAVVICIGRSLKGRAAPGSYRR